MTVGKTANQLKLGKGSAFVKTHLKRLEQNEDTWEADFRAMPKPQGQTETHYLGLVVALPQGNPLVCIANFAGTPHENFRLGLPWAGEWMEALNTDAAEFGGSGVGNLGVVTASEGACNGQPAFATLTVPPLGVLYLTPKTA